MSAELQCLVLPTPLTFASWNCCRLNAGERVPPFLPPCAPRLVAAGALPPAGTVSASAALAPPAASPGSRAAPQLPNLHQEEHIT